MPNSQQPKDDYSSEVNRYFSATDVARAMLAHPGDDRYRMRAFFELIRGADEVGSTAMQLVVEEPPPVGDPRFDALLGGAAEYIAARLGQPTSAWANKPGRFLDQQWWVSDLPSVRGYARTGTPLAFKRRGIWLDEHDLFSV